jgi:hypothetical protein
MKRAISDAAGEQWRYSERRCSWCLFLPFRGELQQSKKGRGPEQLYCHHFCCSSTVYRQVSVRETAIWFSILNPLPSVVHFSLGRTQTSNTNQTQTQAQNQTLQTIQDGSPKPKHRGTSLFRSLQRAQRQNPRETSLSRRAQTQYHIQDKDQVTLLLFRQHYLVRMGRRRVRILVLQRPDPFDRDPKETRYWGNSRRR